MTDIKERLQRDLSMSQFASKYEMDCESNRQRKEAADHIQILETTHKNLHDHIASQEKRIAELEAQIAAQAGQEPIGYLSKHELGRIRSGHDATMRSARFGPSPLDEDVPAYLTNGALTDHEWIELYELRGALEFAAPPSPADAIDAERYRWLRDTLMNSFAGGVEVNDEKLSYQSSDAGEEVRVFWYPVTPVGFCQSLGSNLDDAIDAAMKADK